MKRLFWVTDNPRRPEYARAHVTAPDARLTPVQPKPTLGPFPFTPRGVDLLSEAVAAKWGTTSAEWATEAATALLARLAPVRPS